MLLKYKLYNIFYNHEKEIELLSKLEVKERSIIQNKKVYKEWIKNAKNDFYRFVHELELARRRKKVNHEMHSLCLLYTSDAADDLLCVDLGGRRIIKHKK